MDEIVQLKLAGKSIGQIAIKLNLHANIVTYIIYEKRREDCKHLIKNNLPQLPHAKKGGKK
jgi:orotate phosphoribosyltransferase-like protein